MNWMNGWMKRRRMAVYQWWDIVHGLRPWTVDLSLATYGSTLGDTALPRWPDICDLSRVVPVSSPYFACPLTVRHFKTFLVFHAFSFHFLATMPVLVLGFSCYPFCVHVPPTAVWSFSIWLQAFPRLFCICFFFISYFVVPDHSSIRCCHLWCTASSHCHASCFNAVL